MMDPIKAAREMGKAIQNSPEYIAMKEAEKACDGDAKLQELIGDFNLVRMNLTEENAKAEKDDKKMCIRDSIIAGAILVSSYMIIVLFNGFGQMHWEESLNELKSSFMGAFQSAGDLFNQVGKQLGSGSTSEDLILDPPVGQQVRVHFIDVGQGESVLIEGGGESVLIDAGENNQGETVLSYLEKAGIDQLTMAVGTHPHSDHIGGMDTVMQGITVGKLLMPDLPDDLIPTTKTYLSVLDAAEQTQTEMVYALSLIHI